MVTRKIKKLLSAFQQPPWQPNLAEQRLRVGDTIPKSRERVTKWLRGHYLLNVFEASACCCLENIKFIECSFLDEKIILMLSY